MRTSTRLASLELEDSQTGEAVRLGDYWEDAPAVFIFLRHFG